MSRAMRGRVVVAWAVTIAFVLIVGVPLLIERISVTHNSKTLFVNFQLKDEDARRHVGWFCPGYMYFMDVDFTEYGYEAPEGTDVAARRQTFVDNRDAVKTDDGFVWGDGGFLWASIYKFAKRGWLVEGQRLGLGRPVPIQEQTELTLPGAPWDVQSQTTSLFGRFPDYEARFENEHFAFALKMSAAVPAWNLYNDGVPFSAGDFGRGSMNELPVSVTGTIVHKKAGKTFNVSGTALMQDAVGVPWGYASWGAHDWTALHFDGGWGGSIWKAQDNWQWGYHHGPNIGWIFDPEAGRSHRFDRVELMDTTLETDEATGARWPKTATWRAIGPTATLMIQTQSVSWIPGELKIPPSPVTMKMSHGLYAASGQLIRRDGSVAKLDNGAMIGEHYEALFPDYVVLGPVMLVLLIVAWGAVGLAMRRETGRSRAPVLVACAVALVATWMLWYAWMNAPTVM